MPHKILVAQGDHVKVCLAKILSVGKKRGKKTIASLCSKAEDEHPVKEPLRLVKHLHRELAVAGLNDVLQLANCNLLDAFTALLVLDLTCKETPEDLAHQSLVLGRGTKDFLKIVQVLFGL